MISIVLATYNGSKYIIEQLQSVLNQTFLDFELIVVDDYSDDETTQKIKKYFASKDFTNYKILINKENVGVNKSFEKAIKLSRGEYIAFSDQDDIWDENKLETLLSYLLNSNLTVVGCQSEILDSKKIYKSTEKKTNIFGGIFLNHIRGASLLVQREYLLNLLPFPETDIYDKWIVFNAVIDQKLIKLNYPLDKYRIHKNNIVGTSFKNRTRTVLIEDYLKKIKFYKKLQNEIKRKENYHEHKYFEVEIDKILIHLKRVIKLIETRFSFTMLGFFIKYFVFLKIPFKLKLIYFYYLLKK